MFCKTSVGYDFGCVTGAMGAARLPLPAIGAAMEEPALGWKLCRLSRDIMILADCLAESKPKGTWQKILTHTHGILLRRLGKKRVVYLVSQLPQQEESLENSEDKPRWHSNVNLVTGVDETWLKESFSLGQTENTCVVAGMA